jgi:nucleotide-binding universal stress UspA family protein
MGVTMIRSILLPVGEGPLSAVARDYAFWLARKDGSRIHVLAVIDVKTFEIPVLGTPDGFMPSVVTPPIAESQSLLNEMTVLARERVETLGRECSSRSILCSTDIKTGIPGELIAREAMAHDVIVMSRSGYTRAPTSDGRLDPLVSQVIRGSIRPVLVSGQKFQAGDSLNLLVAFDGSIHAGRVLAVAAELGARPGVVCTLVTIAGTQEAGEETQAPAESYLYHHGVTPKKQVILGSKPSEMICELVTTAKTDILIMGAYGHRPMREMLFGSTTERVLSHCAATVILQS